MNNRYLLLTLTEKIKLYSFKVFTIRNYCMERQKRMLEIIRYLKGQMYGWFIIYSQNYKATRTKRLR